VTFGDSMQILSMVELESGRELVDSHLSFNRLQLFEDVPVEWDAWDIDSDYETKPLQEIVLTSSEVVANGPHFIQIRNEYRIGRASRLVQDQFFYAGKRRVDFDTKVEWHENHRMLKTAFAANLHTEQVRCEVQYGNVLRSSHSNRPADRAQFEFCAHKWVCVEDSGGGVALLNDCKYGHDARGSVMRMTLLRSPKAPDPDADMGTHYFTYSLLPFAGHFSVESVVRPAYELNSPIIVSGAAASPDSTGTGPMWSGSLFELDNPNVLIESVKRSEDATGIVVRLYEASGARCSTVLKTGFSIRDILQTNMLERGGESLSHTEETAALRFGAFEIKTLKLIPRGRD
jgi:alpha-mannosidase